MKRQHLIYSLLFLICVFLTVSCQKDIDLTEENSSLSDISITEGKEWFMHNIENNNSARISGSDDKKALWDYVYEDNFSNGKVLVMPLVYKELSYPKNYDLKEKPSKKIDKLEKDKMHLSVNQLSKLIMYKGKDGQMQVETMLYVPDEDYLDKKKGKSDKNDYTGIIIVSDWTGKFLRGFNYKNGKVITNIKSIGSIPAVKSGKVNVYNCGGWWDYVTVSGGGAPGSDTHLGNYHVILCDDSPGSGAENGSPSIPSSGNYSSTVSGGPRAGTSNPTPPTYDKNKDTKVLDKCSGVYQMWYNSTVNDLKECAGFLLNNGNILILPMENNTYNRSDLRPVPGVWEYDGVDGAATGTYIRVYKNNGTAWDTYFAVASIHTHPNAILNPEPSNADRHSPLNGIFNFPDYVIAHNTSYKMNFSNGQFSNTETFTGGFRALNCNEP